MSAYEVRKVSGLAAASFDMDATAQASSLERYVAVVHKLAVEAPEADLQRDWEAVAAYCGTMQCEVVSSTIAAKTGDSHPSGNIVMRVTPGDLGKLLSEIEKRGKVLEHTTQTEDKTTAVVDADAKIKNLTAFRDNLRGMLAKPGASVKDVVEIQSQLTDVQSQLDSETAQRKILANETEKVRVEVVFNSAWTGGKAGTWGEIGQALRESGEALAESTAALITFIVTLIPWTVVIVPGVWLLVRAWKRLRRKRVGFAEGRTTS